MMYNPYNWNVNKIKSDSELDMPIYPGPMVYNCILDELGKVSNELEMTRLKYLELKRDFKKTEKRLNMLEDRRNMLIKKMVDD